MQKHGFSAAITAPLALAAVGLVLPLQGCAAPRGMREPWVYGLSRNYYDDQGPGGEFFATALSESCTQEAAVAALAIFVLPFALDTALLPITVPHDLLVRR